MFRIVFRFVLISFFFILVFSSCFKKINNPFVERKYSHTELLEATKDPDPEIRSMAINALANKAYGAKKENNTELMEIIERDACKRIKMLLDDKAWQVRKSAVSALHTINCSNLENSIISKLENDKIEVQMWAAWALEKYPSKEAIELLKNVFFENRSSFFKPNRSLSGTAGRSLRAIIDNNDFIDSVQLSDFIETPPIPDGFALIYMRCDDNNVILSVGQTKITKLENYEYTCFLVKNGEYKFHAEDARAGVSMFRELNVDLEGGQIYNFYCRIFRSQVTDKDFMKKKYGSNVKSVVIESLVFDQKGSEKEYIRYKFRPPLIAKINL